MQPKDDSELRKKVEERYMILQLIGSQIQELEKEISAIEQRTNEVITLKSNLEGFSEQKANSKSFSSLGLGIYAESEIKNAKEVLVNVGAGVMVKKKVEEATAMLDKQIQQTDSVTQQLMQNLTALSTRAQEIEREVQELIQ